MKDRQRFAHRIDMSDDDSGNIVERLAGVQGQPSLCGRAPA